MVHFTWFTVLLAFLLPVKSLYAGDSCMEDDREGTCLPISECVPILDVIRKAGHPMPIHIRKRLQAIQCGFEAQGPVVCCVPSSNKPSDGTSSNSNDGTEPTEATPVQPSPTPGLTQTETRIGTPQDVQNHPNLHLLPQDCGLYEDDRLVGGEKTAVNEMPWMVLLSFKTARGISLGCGGSLINERYILTAAHCISNLGNKQLKTVILGEHDIRTDPDCERASGKLHCSEKILNVTVESVVAHTGFTLQTLVDDIGLVRLSEPVNLTQKSTRPICLPVTPELQKEDLVGLNGTVAGWGATETGLQSPVLLRVDLPILPNEECTKAYKGKPRIYERQLCAGGIRDKDSCQGDSGGPLMYFGSANGRLVQRGIVSFGAKRCGTGGFPGIYTNVAHYMKWILDNMRE